MRKGLLIGGTIRTVALTILLGITGCSPPHSDDAVLTPEGQTAARRPSDDGEPYSKQREESLVKSWREKCGRRRSWASERGIMYDSGGRDKLVVVQVTNLDGEPLPSAVIDVRFYYEGEDGNHAKAPADAQGMIRFRSPGWFGPDRMEICVVSAPGHRPRMVTSLKPSEAELTKHRKAREAYVEAGEAKLRKRLQEAQSQAEKERIWLSVYENRHDMPCLELTRKIVLEAAP